MKRRLHHARTAGGGAVVALIFAGCVSTTPEPGAADPVVGRALTVIETNCVHCHGEQRLLTMPAVADLESLRALTGTGGLIVPGSPEGSRFFTVVTLSDAQTGAMPPTGHAITPAEVEVLRAWIAQGAALPPGNRPLQPKGEPPRST
jgi:mono/diheme cytochrome c family protein